jgi:hypothetical protein
MAARPGSYSRPPVIVESGPRVAGPNLASDRRPPPPYPVAPEADLAREGSESFDRGVDSRPTIVREVPAVVVGPVSGLPYYVIRPPGTYPYGPGGVVVPGVVPPFVRRMLDRVLP